MKIFCTVFYLLFVLTVVTPNLVFASSNTNSFTTFGITGDEYLNMGASDRHRAKSYLRRIIASQKNNTNSRYYRNNNYSKNEMRGYILQDLNVSAKDYVQMNSSDRRRINSLIDAISE